MHHPSYWDEFGDIAQKQTFRAERTTLEDGHTLAVYEAGSDRAPPVVIVTPYATPFLLMSRIATRLAEKYRIIGWENRGSPYLDEVGGAASTVTAEMLGKDLRELLHSRGLSDAHFVGWCGGVLPILHATHCLGVGARSLALIAPADLGGGGRPTPYQSYFLPLLARLAVPDAPNVDAICNAIRSVAAGRVVETEDDATILKLCNLNFRDRGTIQALGRLVSSLNAPPACSCGRGSLSPISMFTELCSTVPTLVLHCRDDDVVSYHCSLAAADAARRVRLVLEPDGGHYIVYKDFGRICAEIEKLVTDAETPRSSGRDGQTVCAAQ